LVIWWLPYSGCRAAFREVPVNQTIKSSAFNFLLIYVYLVGGGGLG
jgi:hypothetical protein